MSRHPYACAVAFADDRIVYDTVHSALQLHNAFKEDADLMMQLTNASCLCKVRLLFKKLVRKCSLGVHRR